MLSRRVFRQLTDGLLLETASRPVVHCPAVRHASSSSSTRWKTRQGGDFFAKEARVQGLKSRAAFKLLEINEKHKLFKPGQTVVDLGYAPGSWSQVRLQSVPSALQPFLTSPSRSQSIARIPAAASSAST